VGVWGPAVVPALARATGSSADLWTLVLATEPLLVTRSNNLTRHVRETTARRIHIPPYNPVRSLDKSDRIRPYYNGTSQRRTLQPLSQQLSRHGT
jgi:hypothetical protein